MTLARIAGLTLTAMLACTTAQADWQPTRWNMTPEEVVRVLPAAVPTPASAAFGARGGDSAGQTTYLYARVSRSSGSYDVRLGFIANKLKSVELAMVDASERQCDQARANLQRRYGTPVSGGEGAGGRYDSWKSDKDAVVFIYRSDPGPRCLVLMSPADSPKSDAGPTATIAML